MNKNIKVSKRIKGTTADLKLVRYQNGIPVTNLVLDNLSSKLPRYSSTDNGTMKLMGIATFKEKDQIGNIYQSDAAVYMPISMLTNGSSYYNTNKEAFMSVADPLNIELTVDEVSDMVLSTPDFIDFRALSEFTNDIENTKLQKVSLATNQQARQEATKASEASAKKDSQDNNENCNI